MKAFLIILNWLVSLALLGSVDGGLKLILFVLSYFVLSSFWLHHNRKNAYEGIRAFEYWFDRLIRK